MQRKSWLSSNRMDCAMTRRTLIQSAGAAATVWTASSWNRVLGANDRVQLGLIGCGGRGQYVMSVFQKTSQVDVTAVCDVFGERRDEAAKKPQGAQTYGDHRKLREQKGLDAVLVATPDHWHAQCAIDA